MISVCLVCEETVKMFSGVTAPFYVSTSNVLEIEFLCILASIWYYHCIFILAVQMCSDTSHCGLNLSLQMASDVKCLVGQVLHSLLIFFFSLF